MQVEYVLESNPARRERVHARYASELQELERLGFRELCCYTELLERFSLIRSLPVVVFMMLRREILAVRSPLRAGASFVLLVSNDPPAIAVPMGFGAKFYTALDDGQTLISTSFESAVPARVGSGVFKYSENDSLSGCWQAHAARIATLAADGVHPTRPLDFGVFVTMGQREQAAIFGKPVDPDAAAPTSSQQPDTGRNNPA